MEMKQFYEALLTTDGFTGQKNRPLIYSEATFAGSGAYGGTWLGDIPFLWQSLRLVISQILNMNMFGIPNTIVDVCGDAGTHLGGD